MLAYTYVKKGLFELREKPEPELSDTRDAIVAVYPAQFRALLSDMRWSG